MQASSSQGHNGQKATSLPHTTSTHTSSTGMEQDTESTTRRECHSCGGCEAGMARAEGEGAGEGAGVGAGPRGGVGVGVGQPRTRVRAKDPGCVRKRIGQRAVAEHWTSGADTTFRERGTWNGD
jgi:hypothetical protein